MHAHTLVCPRRHILVPEREDAVGIHEATEGRFCTNACMLDRLVPPCTPKQARVVTWKISCIRQAVYLTWCVYLLCKNPFVTPMYHQTVYTVIIRYSVYAPLVLSLDRFVLSVCLSAHLSFHPLILQLVTCVGIVFVVSRRTCKHGEAPARACVRAWECTERHTNLSVNAHWYSTTRYTSCHFPGDLAPHHMCRRAGVRDAQEAICDMHARACVSA